MAETHNQVTLGAGGFTFGDSFGSWRTEEAYRMYVNLNFDVTGPAATYSGATGGLSAQGAEPDRVGYRFEIRPYEVDRMAAHVFGAVPGRTSRDERDRVDF